MTAKKKAPTKKAPTKKAPPVNKVTDAAPSAQIEFLSDPGPVVAVEEEGPIADQVQLDATLPPPVPEEDRAPDVGKAAGWPATSILVSVTRMAMLRACPEMPLSDEEAHELFEACKVLEEYYGPDLSGPAWMWGRLALVAASIAAPRIPAIRDALASGTMVEQLDQVEAPVTRDRDGVEAGWHGEVEP